MRNLSFLLAFLPILTFIQAQNPLPTKIDSMLVEIDQSTFTSGVLYDRTVGWSNLTSFNEEDKIANADYFEQALLDMYKASNEQKFVSHYALRANYTSDTIYDVVDVGILNATFHKLNYKPENEQEGALNKVEDQFEKINNDQPVFMEKHAFVASPLKRGVIGNTITFKFGDSFLFNESSSAQLQNLVANFDTNEDFLIFDNGQFITNTISVDYNESGYKTITFEATFSDGTSKITQAAIHVERILYIPPNPQIENGTIDAELPFQGYDEATPRLGRLDYRIFYSTPNPVLMKPIIIIDGFDPGDKRKIQDTDPHPGTTNEDHVSIEEMMSYIDSSGIQHFLIPELNSLGYDVVIVNHPSYSSISGGGQIDGGADYIERNALTHIKLYQELNSKLIQNNSSEQLVIVGPSMGGQISRYALAYMEKNNLPHNTRLWVSVDSPHIGANIPIGLQAMVNQVASSGNVMAQDFVDNQLGTSAAKQQIIEQFNGWNGNQLRQEFFNSRAIGQGFSENRGHPFFVEFYNNLYNNRTTNNRGYPENLRKIALVNGALTGKRDFFNPFTQEFDSFINNSQIGANLRAFQTVCSPWPICWDIHIGSSEAYNMPGFNGNGKVSRFKLLFNDQSKYATNINSRGNMDNVPGGWFPGFDTVVGDRDGTDPIVPSGGFWASWEGIFSTISSILSDVAGGAELNVYNNEHTHSFIPTISSLGFFNPDFNWHERLNRNLACTNEIPFDSYFGPKINERHTSFTEESMAWLMEELAGNPQPPTVYLEGADMNGPAAVCASGPATYDFDTCVSPPVESWEVSGNLQILTSDDTSVTVQAINGTVSGSGFIKAIYPYTEVKKTVWVGNPTQAPVITALTQNFPDSPVNYTFEIDPSISTVQGTVLEREWGIFPTYMVQIMNEDQVMITTPSNEGILLDYYYKFRNECGWSPQSEAHGQTVEDPNGGGGIESEVILFPNSSDQELHIDLRTTANDTYILDLYDQYANLLHHSECTNILKTIDTYSLDNGIYFLHISNGEELVIKQVVINH
ncbi:T9SS type A sorting domain-containing protein [Altibacter lentus]|uniref:T9SS type A sorting domain-containing protein n=1 Tax=Altibacter lentus TaxID=1223410 RepID=UPI0005539FE0|nr:T9SS type A sorting domain-containing protein [Altibacter lentus]